MVDCDTFMNVTLRDVYLTSPDGEKFWKLKEVYIRGNVVSVGFFMLMSIATSPTRAPAGVARDRSSQPADTYADNHSAFFPSLLISFALSQIKYLRVADQILDQVQEDQLKYREQARGGNGPNRGGRGGECLVSSTFFTFIRNVP